MASDPLCLSHCARFMVVCGQGATQTTRACLRRHPILFFFFSFPTPNKVGHARQGRAQRKLVTDWTTGATQSADIVYMGTPTPQYALRAVAGWLKLGIFVSLLPFSARGMRDK
ncbi:hypothetical protein BDZ94DRAFT_1276037 [Collybia nuda]|uniref:Uncharacterized protein n=1 Tax=Collybia nuda TaxID=64659 RepID=A0A9P5XRM1_9AGAR|nr:hypothetical protein BDZ94DRAFT_1276037 [Collybia nuda]